MHGLFVISGLRGRLAKGERRSAIHVIIRTRIAGLVSPCASRPLRHH